ncbi:PREDICTED: inactive TPR repeat-containing thioredoxin TTL3-like [Tarenaya hassleriana]|uniref:inactive TPR repeat-containing thioredoxin TTL3-like n=1 Tax=Tarenaya hassleriana TaxID=28532 RepID=UPI00053C55EC|nr:PREDICTED: inactive TPR repeat-containing thioredoxin TTL3-like [Tarenaya hassleriana]
MEENPSEKKSGCGLLSIVFGRRGLWSKKSTGENGSQKSSMSSNVPTASVNIQFTKSPGTDFIPKKAQISDQRIASEPTHNQKPILKPSSIQYPNNHQLAGYTNQQPRNNDSNGGSAQPQVRKVSRGVIGISGELESMITDHQKAKGSSNGSLVRASSSNVMLYGNLGNLRQPGTTGNNYGNAQNQTGRVQNNVQMNSTSGYGEMSGPTATKKSSSEQSGSLCRAISTRMDPETLKIMGNEDYKNGNFAEALALYEAAIAIDPNKASYRSNKSAALTALGRILEAVFECREAIRIEPHYHRAHHRLANLYIRLGEVEKAIYHFKHSGPEADQEDITKARTVQTHLNKCTEAKNRRDWNALVRETTSSISAGADSAPQVYALQAEAFLRINRHQEADDAMSRNPNFDSETSTKYYGAIGYAGFLAVWAQVHMSCGRFEEAMEAIQRASKLDGNNREVQTVMRRAQAVTSARSRGNELFKAGRFEEASAAYGDGLAIDPKNSVLLCNRAACRSKLSHFDKAVEDCSAALALRPGYVKARLRRADCNARMGNWEKAVEDYEILKEQIPEDEEVERGLSEAKQQLMKRRGHGT